MTWVKATIRSYHSACSGQRLWEVKLPKHVGLYATNAVFADWRAAYLFADRMCRP